MKNIDTFTNKNNLLEVSYYVNRMHFTNIFYKISNIN